MVAPSIRAGLPFFYKGVFLQRSDLVLEVSGNLDANGAYVTDWIDSGGINSVRVAASTGGWQVEQSSNATNILTPVDASSPGNGVQGELDVSQFFISARYFRLTVSLGSQYNANIPFALSVRRAS